MSYKQDFNVFVGATSGAFKGIKITDKGNIIKNIQSLSSITENHEVTAMAWGDDDEKEILMGCGVKGVRRAILTAVKSGEVKLWKFNKKEQLLINAGANLHRMRHSHINKNIIATGGEENELKLFDLERQSRIFLEKNVRHDSLELRVPISISDIGFLPNSSNVVTTSKYGFIRLYDPDAQRRPVINLTIKDEALTTLAIAPKEHHIVVGSGKGRMNLIDLRKPGKILNTYKDFVGSITSLACSAVQPYIISTGLDRHLRIHHLETKKLLKKVYLTSKINCMVLRSDFTMKDDDENDKIKAKESISTSLNGSNRDGNTDDNEEFDDSEAEYDALFDKMDVIAHDKNDAYLAKEKRKLPTKQAIIVDDSSDSEKAEKRPKLIKHKTSTKFKKEYNSRTIK
ncbi:WD repeat-containing protein 74 isoform X2 [Cephus cinctus]|uniref:WD repeat-containing protein 74 isoform X2 n=1 Tax=Cephus cinctus TaxID=211228 RepID=A0AAJ7BI52_CEPCN|nr:WD repeat-containing protein 74 isoform X2 [Cephus cinctus]